MKKEEAVQEYVEHVIDNLYELSKDDLINAWCELNSWKWDNKLGKRPVRWDSMKKRKHTLRDYMTHRITKSDFIDPINDKISDMVGRKILLKQWNIRNNEMTDEEFEASWKAELLELEQDMFEED